MLIKHCAYTFNKKKEIAPMPDLARLAVSTVSRSINVNGWRIVHVMIGGRVVST